MMGKAPCCSKLGLNRGPWSPKEDMLLSTYIQAHGEGHWRSLPNKAGLLRCGKSCRLRWMNYLRPGIKRGNISPDEEDLIIRLHSLLGNRWSLIAGRLPGRTDNEIKNYWNTHLIKRLRNPAGAGAAPVKPKTPRKKVKTKISDHEVSEKHSDSNKKKLHAGVDIITNNNNINNTHITIMEPEPEREKIKVYAPKPVRNLPGFSRSNSLDSLKGCSSCQEEASKVGDEEPHFAWSALLDFGDGNTLVGEGDNNNGEDEGFLMDGCDFLFEDDTAPNFSSFSDNVYDEYLAALRFE